MIRFIDLTGQIDDEFQFAWFDTCLDKFIEFNDNHTWSSWQEFEYDFDKARSIFDLEGIGFDIDRFKQLFPKDKIKGG